MIFDALIQKRLSDGRVVHFAVAVTAVADEVHDDVAAKRGAILRGESADAHDGVWIFGVDVEDRHGLAFGDVGSEARRMLLRVPGRKDGQVVHDDVNGAADGVGLEIREIQRFRPNALARESRVAMHNDGNDFVQSFPRTVDVRSAQAVASLFRAHPAHGDRIHRLQMARIRNEMDADLFAGARDVSARRAHVIFHVARTQYAAWIDVFKTSDHLMRRLARRVDHYVQAAAVTHAHCGFEPAMFARGLEHVVQERNQCDDTFEREALGATLARLQNLFEKIGANQTLKDFVLIDLAWRSFEPLSDPAAALRLLQMHEIGANRAAVDAAGFFSSLSGQRIQVRVLQRLKQAEGIEGRLQVAPAAESVENPLALFVTGGFFGGFCPAPESTHPDSTPP